MATEGAQMPPPVFGWSKNFGSMVAKVAGYIPVAGSIVAVARAIVYKVEHKKHSPEVQHATIARCVLEAIPVVNTIALPIADLVMTVKHYRAERFEKLKLTGEDIVAPGWEKLRQKNYDEAVVLFELAQDRYKKGDAELDRAYLGLGQIYMNKDSGYTNLPHAKACFLAVQNKKLAAKGLTQLAEVCRENGQASLGTECDKAASKLTR